MTIDYYGRFACKVREEVSDNDLLRMEKAKNRAEAVLELMRADPKNQGTSESDWSFAVVVTKPSGQERQQLRVAEVLEEAAPLAKLSVHCEGCPFKIDPRPFGCGGAIRYPISASTETWLMSRLANDLSSLAGTLLTRAIHELAYDGAGFETVRRQGKAFESPRAVVRKWGGFFSRTTINSNQLFHMLFGVGHLSPGHAKFAALILGFVDDSGQLVLGPAERSSSEDDAGVAGMKQFLRTMALAGTRGVEVFIDA